MTEYQGYPSKTAHDIALLDAATAEMAADVSSWKNVGYIAYDEAQTFTVDKPMLSDIALSATSRPIRPEDFSIKWRDPSPITLSDMEAIMADIERITERQNRAMRFYSNAWATTRHMAGMEPPRDTAILDSFPLT